MPKANHLSTMSAIRYRFLPQDATLNEDNRFVSYDTSWKYVSKYADDYSPRASMPIPCN